MADIVAVVIQNPEQPIKAILAPGIGEVTAAIISEIGPDGLSGYSGFSGFSGYSGFSGKSGFSGFSGFSGDPAQQSGYSGFSGKSGYSGFSGPSGYSGFSGSGISGYSGFSGSGTSGFSGFSGKSGFSGFSGSGAFFSANTARVDPSGSDSTGVVGDLSKPFLTVQAAINAIQAGSYPDPVIDIGATTFSENVTTSLESLHFISEGNNNRAFASITTTHSGTAELRFFFQSVGDITATAADTLYITLADSFANNITNSAGGIILSGTGSSSVQIISCPGFPIVAQGFNAGDFTGIAEINSAGSAVIVTSSIINTLTAASSITLQDSRLTENDAGITPTYNDFLLLGIGPGGTTGQIQAKNSDTDFDVHWINPPASGFSGYSGFSGSGISGYSGFCGLSGYSGFSGKSGYSGFCGLSGYSGFSAASPGASGFSGFCGLSGYSGFCGLSGYSGFCGLSGYSGFSAASPGASGFSGYSGFCGLSGYSGFCGLSGYSGYSGFSGISGYSAFSGFSGTTGHAVYAGASPPTTDVGIFTIAVTGVDLKAAATTTVFTVPTSRTFILTGSQVLVTAVTGGGAGTQTYQIKEGGGSRSMTSALASASGTPVANQTVYSQYITPAAGYLVTSTCTAGNAVQFVNSTSQAGSTTVTGTVFVSGYYSS